MEALLTKVRENWQAVLILLVIGLGFGYFGIRRLTGDAEAKGRLQEFLEKKRDELEIVREKASIEIEARRQEEQEVLDSLEKTEKIEDTKRRLEALIEIRGRL